jgi:hypothetical protein
MADDFMMDSKTFRFLGGRDGIDKFFSHPKLKILSSFITQASLLGRS